MIASGVTSIPDAMLKVARDVKAGGFHPGMIEFGMRDGMVHVVLNPQLEGKIPPAALDRMKNAEQAILAGVSPPL